jgi:hypothetical protein
VIVPSAPCAGPLTIDSVSWSPSASVHVSGTDTAVPTLVRRETSEQLAGRVTVIETVAGVEFTVPSLAR